MQRDTNQFIIIPTNKFIISPDGNLSSIALSECYLLLLKLLILAPSKNKFVYLSDAKDSERINSTSVKIVLTEFLYQTSFHFFSQTKRFLLDVNIIFESLNSGFLNSIDGQPETEVLYLAEQKNDIGNFLQAQSNKRIKETQLEFDQLPGVNALESYNFSILANSNPHAHLRVALGGTFDHLHIGHKILLSVASLAAKKTIVCGVMHPSTLVNKQYYEFLEPLETRIRNIESFLKLFNPNLAHEIVPIYDAFGTTLTDPSLDTLVVSQETAGGGNLVNTKRIEKSLNPLEIITVEVISSRQNKTSDEIIDAKMSSTSIRKKLSDNTESDDSQS